VQSEPQQHDGGLRAEQTGIVGNDIPLRQKMPDVITLPQLCKDAGWQSHAFGKLLHLGGGRDAAARQRWMDAGRSWHTAQAFERPRRAASCSKAAM
jgi:arylsulfatase A-like enzyme